VDRATALGVCRAAAGELRRAKREIRAPGFPRPYFLSYLIRDEESWRARAAFGALKLQTHERARNAYADVRVGSYRRDQVREGGLFDNDKEAESYNYVDLPFGSDLDGLRHGLWRLTEARYREAVEALAEKRCRELTYREADGHFPAFERRPAVVDPRWTRLPRVDLVRWSRYVERASAVTKRYPDLKDGEVEFGADQICRVFVSSEGSKIVECHALWTLECRLWLLTEGGEALPWSVRHNVADPRELPSLARFEAEIRGAIRLLRRLARAPQLRAFSGPALLEPVPAGLLIHEAVGHRLEGSRLLAAGEGQTFKDSLKERVLPQFLSVRDDPSLERFEGRSLIGHYRYDDEGVAAESAPLIERGVLRGFMDTRTPCRARGHRSNGHARSNYHERPTSRMGLTVIEAEGGLDDRQLKRRLIEEIRRQGAPFGIRIIETSSGETATDAYNFQAFLGEIHLASRVWPDGREEWVRGVNFVGTPLNAIRSIVAAGRRRQVDNSFCGAESGYVPVTTISPALVVSQLELQSKGDTPYSPYTLPMP
jgi:TldD protein